jgi:hypothetical protein
MLGFAQEARLCDATKDQRSGDVAARRIEAVTGKLNGNIRQSASFERREQGLKPLRVLVEDG